MTLSLSFLFRKVATSSKVVRIEGDPVSRMGCQQSSCSRSNFLPPSLETGPMGPPLADPQATWDGGYSTKSVSLDGQ